MKKIKCVTCKIYKTEDEYSLRKEYKNINLNILQGEPECYLYNSCVACYKRSILLYGAFARSKSKNLEFSLVLLDIVIPKFCPVLGIPLRYGIGKAIDNSPTIDRIDNSKGYTKENIVIISYRANRIKSNATIKELEQISNFYKKYEH